MKKRYLARIAAVSGTLLLLLAISGCAATGGTGGGDSGIPPGQALLEALQDDDRQAFFSALPEELRSYFGEEQFNDMLGYLRQNLGEPVSFKFLAELEHPLVEITIWQVNFERRAELAEGVIRQDSLFRVISQEIDGERKIISFNFL